MSATLLDQLLDMGFPKPRAEKAISATKGAGLEQAMDWLISHEEGDGDMEVAPSAVKTEIEANGNSAEPKAETSEVDIEVQTAKSIKCGDCGKLFKSEDEVHFHAVKTQHTNFEETTEEVKPLTEAERKERIDALQARLKERRMESEEEERKKQVDSEKKRRLQGQDITMAKMKHQEEEMKQLVADRKQQKKNDLMVKQQVLEQIKKDREAKKARDAGISVAESEASTPKVVPESVPAQAQKSYDETRIQIRLLDGKCLTHKFKTNESLAAIRLYVEMNRSDGAETPFTLMTNFPKRVFTDADMDTPLTQLGLVPSAVLIVTKPQTPV